MKVLVVIVAYNAMKWINKCLSSLRESSLYLDVLIIDNGSKDGTIEYVRNNFKEVKLWVQKQNLGFGKGNNLGLKYAFDNEFDYVYLLNQDAWILPDTLQNLIDIQRKYPEYGILSPIQINGNRDDLDMNFAYACNNKSCPGFLSDLVFNRYKDVYEIDFVMAAHWLISLECLKKVGGFAPIFAHCGEDDNYLHRLKFHNLKVGICPRAYGIHDREGRIMNSKRAIASLKPVYLASVCNINHSFFKAFIKANSNIMATISYILFRYKKISPILFPLKGFLWIPEILSTRKETKKEGTYIINKE